MLNSVFNTAEHKHKLHSRCQNGKTCHGQAADRLISPPSRQRWQRGHRWFVFLPVGMFVLTINRTAFSQDRGQCKKTKELLIR